MGPRVDLQATDARAVQEFTHRVRQGLGTELIALKLFGSKVTGAATPESDIDVLVVVDDVRPEVRDRVLDIAFDVNLGHDVYISPRGLPGPCWMTRSGGSLPSSRRWSERGFPCDSRDRNPRPTSPRPCP